MLGTENPIDPHLLVQQYLHPEAKVTQALKVLKITPAEYARLLASRSSRVHS